MTLIMIMITYKELCRGMAEPEEKEMVKMKRLARYLQGNGRLITQDNRHKVPRTNPIFSDNFKLYGTIYVLIERVTDMQGRKYRIYQVVG